MNKVSVTLPKREWAPGLKDRLMDEFRRERVSAGMTLDLAAGIVTVEFFSADSRTQAVMLARRLAGDYGERVTLDLEPA